ncbi:hypothetical protein BI364_00015 [Acidihalobacter yilgarnensis]|uniref:DNA replication and repair protein RecF n=1 Tax=Acidihalobacter yilgarnensis TaxID=2819280 RepID=A0A1D8IJR3_9GAMM|nr:DNA replication/repair protein RecF [Acidihalobacter yilgarnensis]AOU96621.1 hypothetical protein BI364_00015 [Acidihalobacter yilgarnensis]
MLTEIAFSNIRNLQAQQLVPGSGVNLITGGNAAGKSSVLEAIHLLSLGRSFRTSQLDRVIRQPLDACWVRGRIRDGIDGRERLIGFQRADKKNKSRVDGADASSVAQLARLFPVQIIHPESHRLLTGGPSLRRAFLDWGCFYADTNFHLAWRQYRRVLLQYNTALKRQLDSNTLQSLETELSLRGMELDESRRRYLSEFLMALPVTDGLWPDKSDRSFRYDSGWTDGISLNEALARNRLRSMRAGTALVGPHRAELRVEHQNEAAAAVLSRGQIKRVTVALMLAQIELYERNASCSCVLMVDDVASELDSESMLLVSQVVMQRGGQCFITALSDRDVEAFTRLNHRMFHVEHGQLSELV